VCCSPARSYSLRVSFDVERLREERMRALYACVPIVCDRLHRITNADAACSPATARGRRERYDARHNVHDYDYHMRLIAAGASVVHPVHFRTWRDSGLAFEFRDATYPAPNRSLASAAAGVLVAGRDRNGAEQGRSVRRQRALLHSASTFCVVV
jgi:hypothetical protein